MADIVLKDRDGNDVNYATNTVRLKMSDGETQEFVNADTVAQAVETTIDLDFSADDVMEVVPEEGTQFSKVTVNKPVDLIPANIPEGMYIAGVGPGEFKGGGSGGGLPVVKYKTGYSEYIKFNYTNNTDVTYSFSLIIPNDAVDVHGYITVKASLINNSGTIKENFDTQTVAVKPEDITYTDYGNGYKRATLAKMTFNTSGATGTYPSIIGNVTSCILFTMPNVRIENHILYAGADCEGLFYYDGYSGRDLPYYLEGVDMRGSKIKELLQGQFDGFSELKKVWFPEGMIKLSGGFTGCTSMEELHFTSETPPAASGSSWYNGLPTTCKIYIPAGALSAYSSASYYPSPANYTFIEE